MNLLRSVKRWLPAVLLILMLLIATTGLSLYGIQQTGSIAQWQAWLDQHASSLRAWRIIFYLATAFAWHRMRRRLGAPRDHRRSPHLFRAELSAIVIVVLLELHMLAQEPISGATP